MDYMKFFMDTWLDGMNRLYSSKAMCDLRKEIRKIFKIRLLPKLKASRRSIKRRCH